MIKEKLTTHLKSAGQESILKTARKYEGPDVGVDNLSITPDEALAAGANKYRLPKRLVQKLAKPALETTVTYRGDIYPLDPQQSPNTSAEPAPLPTSAPQTTETPRIVITEESLRNQ